MERVKSASFCSNLIWFFRTSREHKENEAFRLVLSYPWYKQSIICDIPANININLHHLFKYNLNFYFDLFFCSCRPLTLNFMRFFSCKTKYLLFWFSIQLVWTLGLLCLDFIKSKENQPIYELVQGGIDYLDTRTEFWRQQKPLYARKKEKDKRSVEKKKKKPSVAKYVLTQLEDIDQGKIYYLIPIIGSL